MSQWSDEHLADLLTATFTSHEADADPGVAQRIALTTPPAPRRSWPVLVAAASVALVVVLGVLMTRQDEAPEPAPPAPTPTPVEAGHNRTVAIAEAARLADRVPVPQGATAVDAAPARSLRRLPAWIGSVDPSLTQTAWWVVPMSYDDLVAWYHDSRLPAEGSSGEEDLWWTEPATAAYTEPAVVVTWARLGPTSTAVRVDVTIAARDDRTPSTYVPEQVTSLDVTRSYPYRPAPPSTTITVTDPERLRAIAAAFNGLPGAPSRAVPVPCGSPVGDTHWYAVTFRWPGHTLAVDTGQPLCGIGRSLTLDGAALHPRLEDSEAFDALVEAAFAGVGGRAP